MLSENLNGTKHKCDVILYPQNIFFPYNWNSNSLDKLFKKNGILEAISLENTYSIHFYNKLSYKFKVEINDNSIYEYYAKINCPYTYEYVRRNNLVFE